MSMSEWAKREIKLAVDNSDEDYIKSIYNSALKAFISLCKDGHSGMSIGITAGVLNRLISCKPLSPLTGADDEWYEDSMNDEGCPETLLQNKRCSSVFKKINRSTGEIRYSDVDRFVCENINNSNLTFYSGSIIDIAKRYYPPITMPYVPSEKKIVIYTEDFLVDANNGDFDTQGIFYAIDGNTNEKTDINVYLGEIDGKMTEITFEEYVNRRANRLNKDEGLSHSDTPSLDEVQQKIHKMKDPGKLSDGFHTFDELYYHRMMLFSIICNTYKDVSWKSWKHSDDTMYDDMFIVGVSLPNGDYSYHYDKEFWNKFDVKELEKAPVWDGHKPEDITRLEILV